MAAQSQKAWNTGYYSVLSVQVPRHAARAVGILLVDSSDQLHYKISDVIFSSDEDVIEFWQYFVDDFPSMIDHQGGLATLRFLADVSSNFIQMGPIMPHAVDHPEAEIKVLYEQLVLAERQRQGGANVDELLMARITLSAITQARQNLPNTAANCVEVLRFYKSGSVEFEPLEQLIGKDPSMTAQIIRLANLGAHSMGGHVRSVRDALIRIGTDKAIGYLIGFSLRPLYSTPSLQSVWKNSLACRTIATHFATLSKLESPHECGLMALVADIGKIALLSVPEYESSYWQLRRAGQLPLTCEQMLCGRTHAEISADILEDWCFPVDMIEAVRFHHKPSGVRSAGAAVLYMSECWPMNVDAECNIDEYRAAIAMLSLPDSLNDPPDDLSVALLA